jgi:uncharacterized integral membrane protein (TIGR00698 family)
MIPLSIPTPCKSPALGAVRLASVLALLPGLALSAALAAAGMLLGRVGWLQAHGLGALTLAIVLGMLAGNTLLARGAGVCGAGVGFSRQTLLRLGVMLYGLRLTLQDIGQVGWSGVVTDALVLGSTFALACWVGLRWLRMERGAVLLIGAGSSICGAAAVMAAEPVVQARAGQVTVAVATVVVFGTLAMLGYPLLFALNQHWPVIPGGAPGFGVYVGSTLHEVAQVVAAANSVGAQAVDTAVIAKMVRVMMLAPFLLLLSAWLARDAARQSSQAAQADSAADDSAALGGVRRARPGVPGFAIGFVAVVLFNSLALLPAGVQAVMRDLDTALLAMAMAALGLSTPVSALRQAGLKPMLLALILLLWLVAGGALINHWVPRLMGG